MPFADPTPTVQDLVVSVVHNGNEAIKSVVRATAEAFEPFRVNLYPPIASDILPDLSELVAGWINVAERVLRDEKDLLVTLAELFQPNSGSIETPAKKSTNSSAKTPVAA